MENINSRGKKNKEDKAFKIIAFFLFIMCIANIFTNFNLNFTSDVATANLLAKEQIYSNQLFPENWMYGTGVWLFFYNILIMPLSVFSNNQILLRNIAVLIVLLFFMYILWYLMKKILKSNSWLIVVCFLFSTTSPHMIDMLFAQAAYLPILLNLILLLVLFLKTCDNEFIIINKTYGAITFLFIIYLVLRGTIAIAYYIIPLIGAIVLQVFIENYKLDWDDIKYKIKTPFKIFLYISAATIIGMVGHLCLAKKVGYSGGENIIYGDANNLLDSFFRFILEAIGYKSNVYLFSIDGIMNFIKIGVFIFAVSCCILLVRKYYEQSFEMKIWMNFSLVSIVVLGYFCLIFYSKVPGNERYWIQPLFFIYFLAAYYIYHYLFNSGFLMKVGIILGIIVFTIPNTIVTIPNIVNYKKLHKQQLGLVEFLKENNIEYGYASYWNAYNNMVLSDFEVDINAVYFNDKIMPMHWLNSKRYYNPEQHEGETFLLMTTQEKDLFDMSRSKKELGEPAKILQYEDYYIYIYDYNISMNSFGGTAEFDELELLPWMVSSMKDIEYEGGIALNEGQIIYGPYMMLKEGQYQIEVYTEDINEEISYRLTSEGGENILQEGSINTVDSSILFNTMEEIFNFEVVLTTNQKDIGVLKSLVIRKLDN